MKLKCLMLVCLGSLALGAGAEEAVVIDSGMLGQQPAAESGSNAPASPGGAAVDAAAPGDANANRERVLRGGKMSARQKTAVVRAELVESNKLESETYLANNKAKEGVTTLPSGLQYEILKAGKGKKPREDSVVVCNYRGTLLDGTEIDKSAGEKSTAVDVSTFMSGLKEAVKLMPAGSKWLIVLPPQLAYGTKGNRGVGPNAVLLYEMEIFKVK